MYKLILLKEARTFLAGLPPQAMRKVLYNETQKTPPREIAKAEETRRRYFETKKKE